MRTFYKTTVSIDVLSEEPIEELDLNAIAFEIVQGDCVGHNLRFERVELGADAMAAALYAAGSEPDFFGLPQDEATEK